MTSEVLTLKVHGPPQAGQFAWTLMPFLPMSKRFPG